MKLQSTTLTGCGSRSCRCAGVLLAPPAVTVNGVVLQEFGPGTEPGAVAGRVVGELLRQEAVAAGLLPDTGDAGSGRLDANGRQAIESLVEQAIGPVMPSEADCRAWYDADPGRFVRGHVLHVRHILFAEWPEGNVHALLVQAEQALLELIRPVAPRERFAQLAAALSACPTGVTGGDLGWIGPDDCEPEMVNELFDQKHSRWGMGVHPRLIHTQRGFHIIEVVGRRKDKPRPYAEVRERIARELAAQRLAWSRQQYVRDLALQSQIQGIAPEAVWTQGTARFWSHD